MSIAKPPYVLIDGAANCGRAMARRVRDGELVAFEPVSNAAELNDLRRLVGAQHPNLVAILEVGEDRDQRGYAIEERIAGATLAALLAAGAAPRARLIVPVIVDALYGLHAIHALGLVHGRLDASCLAVDQAGRCKVAGIRRVRTDDATIAPEQVAGEPVDERTDIFAVGVVLWTALTGKSLVRTEAGPQATALHRPIPWPSTVGHQPPAILDAVVLKALDRDPANRYASARAMAVALRDVADKTACLGSSADVAAWVRVAAPPSPEPSSAPQPGSASTAPAQPAAPRPGLGRAAAVAAGLAIVGGATLGWQWSATAEPSPPAATLEVSVVDVHDLTIAAPPAAPPSAPADPAAAPTGPATVPAAAPPDRRRSPRAGAIEPTSAARPAPNVGGASGHAGEPARAAPVRGAAKPAAPRDADGPVAPTPPSKLDDTRPPGPDAGTPLEPNPYVYK